jgi:hypothetical protein
MRDVFAVPWGVAPLANEPSAPAGGALGPGVSNNRASGPPVLANALVFE